MLFEYIKLNKYFSRSQKDIEGRKDIKIAMEAERKFFLRYERIHF